MSKNLNILAFVEASLIAAVAMALSFIPDFAEWFTPSFGAIPLVLFSLRRGTTYGLLSGLIWGLLHFPFAKVYYLSPRQVLIEYILAFLVMGLAGVFSHHFKKALKDNQVNKALTLSITAATLAVGVRYFFHYVAGVLFWSSYAPKGVSPYWYSFTVNGTAGGFTLALVIIFLVLLVPTRKYLFLPQK